jgi:cobalt/nickel transport system permease protein
VQEGVAILPDYGFKPEGGAAEPAAEDAPPWPAVDAGTSLSGLVGGAIVAGVVVLMGFVLHRRAVRRRARAGA